MSAPGTVDYALDVAKVLSTNPFLVAHRDLTGASVTRHGLDLLYATEDAAAAAARGLDITTPPVRSTFRTAHDGYRRSGEVAGVTVTIASCWPVATEAAA